MKKSLHEVGFEPTKAMLSDLKSDPFDHSGIRVCLFFLSTPDRGRTCDL